jgi:6-phospho-3-hexuloisomerase
MEEPNGMGLTGEPRVSIMGVTPRAFLRRAARRGLQPERSGSVKSTVEAVLPRILEEVGSVVAQVRQEELDRLAGAIMDAGKVFVCGAGRVGISSRALAMRLVHLGKETHWMSDDTTPGIGEGDLLIANSGSGSSVSTCVIVEQAKKARALIATITANPEGRVALLSDFVVVLPAQTYKTDRGTWSSILPMGSQFELCLWILQDILALLLMERMGVSAGKMGTRHRNLE